MTADEIQQRVDAWLAGRHDWLGQGDARLRWSLAMQWGLVTREFGADSDAALGVLHGLVREAWGDWSIHVVPEHVDRYTVWSGTDGPALVGDNGPLAFQDEDEALVFALESASP